MRMSGELERTEKAIGIIDLGSNSVRLLLVRVHADGSTTILNQVKHMVRLGEGGFTHNRLQEETMARTIAVLRGLAEMCAVYETTEIIAIATAAVRDAVNGPEFIRRVQEKTGIDFTVVSGREEARLIYLGVSSGLEHSKSLRLFIDIGGGSTELIVGDSQSYVNLDSLKLGCVRLTNLFFEDNKGPVSAYTYAALQRYVRNEALHSFQRIAGFEIPEAVASSGTAQNLAEIAAALDMEPDKVRELLQLSQEPISLETPVGEEEDAHLEDFIQDEDAGVPVDEAGRQLLRRELLHVLKSLTPREERVITLRFGLEDGRARTLEELGKEFNVTRERVRQIEAKALRKLRHPSRAKLLRDYLDE